MRFPLFFLLLGCFSVAQAVRQSASTLSTGTKALKTPGVEFLDGSCLTSAHNDPQLGDEMWRRVFVTPEMPLGTKPLADGRILVGLDSFLVIKGSFHAWYDMYRVQLLVGDPEVPTQELWSDFLLPDDENTIVAAFTGLGTGMHTVRLYSSDDTLVRFAGWNGFDTLEGVPSSCKALEGVGDGFCGTYISCTLLESWVIGSPPCADGAYRFADAFGNIFFGYCMWSYPVGGNPEPWTLLFTRRGSLSDTYNNVESCGANLAEYIAEPCSNGVNVEADGFGTSYSLGKARWPLLDRQREWLQIVHNSSMAPILTDAVVMKSAPGLDLFPTALYPVIETPLDEVCSITGEYCGNATAASNPIFRFVGTGYFSYTRCFNPQVVEAQYQGMYGLCPHGTGPETTYSYRFPPGFTLEGYEQVKLWGHPPSVGNGWFNQYLAEWTLMR